MRYKDQGFVVMDLLFNFIPESETRLQGQSFSMQPLRKEKQSKSYKCLHCCKSFKSSNGLKYHKEKVHSDEVKMEISSDVETEGMSNHSKNSFVYV